MYGTDILKLRLVFLDIGIVGDEHCPQFPALLGGSQTFEAADIGEGRRIRIKVRGERGVGVVPAQRLRLIRRPFDLPHSVACRT